MVIGNVIFIASLTFRVVKDTPVEPPPKVIEKPKTPPPAVNETDEETVSTANATTPPPTTPERYNDCSGRLNWPKFHRCINTLSIDKYTKYLISAFIHLLYMLNCGLFSGNL